MENTHFGKKNWWILILFGLVGQIAWAVENLYFNVFVFRAVRSYLDEHTQVQPLDYITLMVQLSGIAATVTTLIVGTLSDKVGNRRRFISYGYLIWGFTVALFGMLSVEHVKTLFSLPTTKALSTMLVLAIIGDCVMTVFGSTANDAAFNAWVTDNTKESFRGKVEGVLAILPLAAMLVVAGGFGILVDLMGFQNLFFALGAVITLCGLAGLFTIEDSKALQKSGTFKDIVYGFKPNVVKGNRILYVCLLLVGVYGIACQIFMPYLIIYMEMCLGFSVPEYSVVFGGAIIIGAGVNLYLTRLSDRKDKAKLLYIAAAVFSIGLFAMYFVDFENKMAMLVGFGVAGLIMMTGYIFISALCGALVRDYTPVENAGKLQGVRMVFSVLIPMLIGPMIGNAINAALGAPITDMTSEVVLSTLYTPASEIFLVAGCVSVLLFAIIPWLCKLREKEKGGQQV